MSDTATMSSLDLRGKTITTYILFAVHQALAALEVGDRVEILTDGYLAVGTDIRAWSRATGNVLVDEGGDGKWRRFVIEKGPPRRSAHQLAAIISDDGLLELLSPLGFALAAGLEGHAVSLYFQGPAVRVLARGYVARMHGLGRPFSRFPRRSLAAAGHVAPPEKIEQLQALGARIFACGPSMEHFRVDPEDLAFDHVTICEYPTFMEQMDSADIHLFV